jgi:hypothetical protein
MSHCPLTSLFPSGTWLACCPSPRRHQAAVTPTSKPAIALACRAAALSGAEPQQARGASAAAVLGIRVSPYQLITLGAAANVHLAATRLRATLLQAEPACMIAATHPALTDILNASVQDPLRAQVGGGRGGLKYPGPIPNRCYSS